MHANFCLNITITIFLQLVEKSKKDDYNYSVQYFNKFKNVGYRLNDLMYHIWELEVLTELCALVEKKELLESTGKNVRVCVFEELK